MARHSMVTGSILRDPVNPDLLRQYLSGLKAIDTAGADQITGLRESVEDYSDISAQDLIAKLQGVTAIDPITGLDDPMAATVKRQQMVDQRSPWDLTNMEKINPALPKMELAGKAKFQTDLDVTKKLRTAGHEAIEREQIASLPNQKMPDGSPNPLYQQALEQNSESNFLNQISAPHQKKEYLRLAHLTPWSIKDETILSATGSGSMEELRKDPTKFDSAARTKALKTIADNIGIQFPGIRDRKVLDSMAADAFGKSKYARQFEVGIADEKTDTIDSMALEGFVTRISEGMSNPDTVAGNKVVVKSMNDMLRYMNINNIKDAGFDDIILRTLERTPLTSTEVLQKVGRDELLKLDDRLAKGIITQEEYDTTKNDLANIDRWEVIDTGIQRKAKKYIREFYRGTYSELGDRILDTAYDRIINSGPDSISVAMQIGQANAATRAKQRQLQADSRFKIYEKNLINLNDIKDRGLIPHITDNLFRQFKEKFKDQEMRSEDDARLKEQVGGLIDWLQTHIGKNLKGEQKSAFRLTARRMIMEHATWDEHTNWFGFRWPTWMGFSADFDVLKKGTPMNAQNKLAVMELFHASIIDPDIIAKAKGNDAKIRQGAILLEKSMASKIKTLGGTVDNRLEELRKTSGTDKVPFGVKSQSGEPYNPNMDLSNWVNAFRMGY